LAPQDLYYALHAKSTLREVIRQLSQHTGGLVIDKD